MSRRRRKLSKSRKSSGIVSGNPTVATDETEPADNLVPETGAFLRERRTVQTAIHSGPLPLPRHFEEYNRTLPGAADRILQMAESEVRNRHMVQARGQISGFGLATTAILVGGAAITFGQSLWGAAIPIPVVIGTISLFFWNRRREKQIHGSRSQILRDPGSRSYSD